MKKLEGSKFRKRALSSAKIRFVSFKEKYSRRPLYLLLIFPVTPLAAEAKKASCDLLALLSKIIATTCNSRKLRKVKYCRIKKKIFFKVESYEL